MLTVCKDCASIVKKSLTTFALLGFLILTVPVNSTATNSEATVSRVGEPDAQKMKSVAISAPAETNPFLPASLEIDRDLASAPVDPKSPFHSILRDLASPFRKDLRALLIGGVATTGVSYASKYSVSIPLQDHVQKHKPLGKFSTLGDQLGRIIPNGIYAAYYLLDFYFTDDLSSKGKSFAMIGATMYSTFVTSVIKYTVQEERPNGSPEKVSFPSGHTTSAFAFAAVVAQEHDWYWGAAAYAMAGFAGFSRINDNSHYLHDVIGGAVIGSLYGLGVVRNSKGMSEKSPLFSKVQFSPILADGVLGLQAQINWN